MKLYHILISFSYHIGIGYNGNTGNDIYSNGVWLAESPGAHLTNTLQNFTMSFCNGMYR